MSTLDLFTHFQYCGGEKELPCTEINCLLLVLGVLKCYMFELYVLLCSFDFKTAITCLHVIFV